MRFLFLNNYNEDRLLRELSETGLVIAEDFYPDIDESFVNPNFNFDTAISTLIDERIVKEYDAIVMPYNFNPMNYLELSGLTIAAHIRLSNNPNKLKPILFIGQEKVEHLQRLTSLASILNTPGVFTTNKLKGTEIIESLKWMAEKAPSMSDDQYKIFLKRLIVEPPSNFDNRHSIANEWGCQKLAKVFDLVEYIPHNTKYTNLVSSLYFKKSKNIITETNINRLRKDYKDFKILLVDDKWSDGWLELFKKVLGCEHINYLDLEPNDTHEVVIKKFIDKYNSETHWDLVLLDLRLVEDDETASIINLTGFNILLEICDDISVPVVIVTASNKIETIQTCLETGAVGYLVKPGPDTKEILVDNFENSLRIVDNIKTVYEKLSLFSHNLVFNKVDFAYLYLKDVLIDEKTVFDAVYNYVKIRKFDFAFFELYKFIEQLCSAMVQDNSLLFGSKKILKWKSGECYWNLTYLKDSNQVSYFKNREQNEKSDFKEITTLAKISAVLAWNFKYNDEQLKMFGVLNQKRNDFAHKKYKPTWVDLMDLLNLLEKFKLNSL